MKKIVGVYFILQIIFFSAQAQVQVLDLLCENLSNPQGMDVLQPRFSWQLVSDKRNTRQVAYEIRVGVDPDKLQKGKDLFWGSGKKDSDSSVHVVYEGQGLQSGTKYFWQVRVWDNHGSVSAWSIPAFWQTGLLSVSDWKAKWIKPGFAEDSIQRPSPLFRKEFTIQKKIRSATAHITAFGLYEASLNGERIGKDYLSPGWTSYNKRLPYQTYDLTGSVKTGKNAIAVTLGSGWYRGYIGFLNKNNFYGKQIALLFQLDIRYTDGTSDQIISDESWKSSTGSIRSSEIYHGELIDARMEKTGWSLPGYDDAGWSGVITADFSKDHLLASSNEPITKHEQFKPVRIFRTPRGENVIDFGQNLVGWVVLNVSGQSGDSIRIGHAEVLDKNGNFYTENLRMAKAEDIYVLDGKGQEVFEPHFTFHGFRYVRIEGMRGDLKAENFTAVALYSDMKPSGNFTSSNPLVNQLQHNIQWGQKGNFLDVPTDCPQRDERLGWTGDAQVFSRTATFNMNVNNFFGKWLKDLAADQMNDGIVPFVIPDVLRIPVGSTGWADASTIIPWNMYLAYGDKKILSDQYPSMKAWVGYMEKKSNHDLWNTGFHFGDWLFYRPDDDNDGRAAVTDKYLIAQCFYAHSVQLLIDAATVLGKEEDLRYFSGLLSRIKEAFLKEYMTPNGRLVSGTQTAYVLALNFDMLPDSLRSQAAARLVENIKSYETHLTTGFLGTPYLCHVLTRFGYTDIAYKLLLQDSYPSWLYPVKMGATTIWERWDGIKPDSSFQTPSMNSFNHYSYGAIGDWMYRVMTGIDTYADGVGYKHIKIMPHPGGGFTYATASLQTYYGKIVSGWKIEQGRLLVDVEIPANTSAEVFVPAESADQILENDQPLSMAKEVQVLGKKDHYIQVKLGSGKYRFSAPVAVSQ
jgi:alpha-L-rhamnosidase